MSRRMYASALAGAILAALAIGVAVSSASSSADKTSLEIQKGNTSCDVPNGNRSLGVATFILPAHSNSLQITANVKHGTPNTTYTVTLLDADMCTPIVTFGKQFNTNRKGKGKRNYTADVGSSRSFVIDVFDGSVDSYSEAAHF